MKILVAPLNWGLGHATRCVPIIRYYLSQGDEVVLGGNGDSILLLQRTFPNLRVVDLPPLELHYDEDTKQRRFYWRAIPLLIRFTIADHYYLRQLLAREHFDRVVSDNRFGLFSRDVYRVYITHQLYPILPKRLRLFQPIVRALHKWICTRYDEVWVPDYAEINRSLSGALSHGGCLDEKVQYVGPLSRFSHSSTQLFNTTPSYSILAILSGLEPQRTIFERQLLERFADCGEQVLLIKGKLREAATVIRKNTITIMPSIKDDDLVAAVQEVDKIIARSGYSTIMDLEVLGVLAKAELHPTPGQSEQEYLADWIKFRTFAP